MIATFTEKDIERLSWHDNHVYGLRLAIGDIDADDWRSDLVLDIDHIVAWVRGDDNAPAAFAKPASAGEGRSAH